MVHVGIAPPDLEVAALELGVIFVDRRQVQRLLAPRRPVHGVHRDAAIDPARAVAGEQLIGQRRQHEVRGGIGLLGQLAEVLGQLRYSHAADQVGCQRGRVHLFHPRPQLGCTAHADFVRHQFAIQDIGPAFGVVYHFLQQLMDAHGINAKLRAHQVHKGIVFLARLARPDDIVEQQLDTVGRSQPPHFQAGPVHDDLAQLADFGMHTILFHVDRPF